MEIALSYMLKRYEDKLEELIGKEKATQFAVEVAHEAFRNEVDGMAPGYLKAFCLQHMNEILGESEDA